ncbi:T9SS type A sorting domain-containing protein [Halosquirtibacter laminarini]|uniref:T9SS type A sorting domain-containing protein n=1 Tax=Halosquirtibacter laminarini TaxID=3374600 RepID=A0AC61NDA3_9BACT|nr:T9SS type A sorting domain-containing protein [Prolixibacteraceae bacterium]
MIKNLLLFLVAVLSLNSAYAQEEETVLFYPTMTYLKGAHGVNGQTIEGTAPGTDQVWYRIKAVSQDSIAYSRPASTNEYKHIKISAARTSDKTYDVLKTYLVLDEVDLSSAIGNINLDFYTRTFSSDKTGSCEIKLLASTSYVVGDVANLSNNWVDITTDSFKNNLKQYQQKDIYSRNTVSLNVFAGQKVTIAIEYSCPIASGDAPILAPLGVMFGDFRISSSLDDSSYAEFSNTNFDDASFGVTPSAGYGVCSIKEYTFGPDGAQFEKITVNIPATDNEKTFYVQQSSSTHNFGKEGDDRFGEDNRYVRVVGKSLAGNKAFLISPEMDFTDSESVYIEFKNALRYGKYANTSIKLLVIEGYTGYDGDGDPLDQIDASAITDISSRVNWSKDVVTGQHEKPNWVNSGKVNLSDFAGKKIRYAFTVEMLDAANTTNVFLDDIKVFVDGIANSVDGFKKNAWTIYPNPVESQFNIHGSEAVNRVEVYSILGNKVADWTIDSQVGVDASTLDAGLYILKLYGVRGTTSIQKLIKR